MSVKFYFLYPWIHHLSNNGEIGIRKKLRYGTFTCRRCQRYDIRPSPLWGRRWCYVPYVPSGDWEMTRCFLYCSPLSGSNIKDGACRSVQKWTLLIPAPAGRDPSRHHRQTPLIKPVGSVHSLNMHISRRLICPEPNQVYIPVNFFNIASFYYL